MVGGVKESSMFCLGDDTIPGDGQVNKNQNQQSKIKNTKSKSQKKKVIIPFPSDISTLENLMDLKKLVPGWQKF